MSCLISRSRYILGASLLGNALEFFDLTLCGVFIPVFGKVFFPNKSEFITILQGFFVFSAAFWMRPFGAIVFGRIGDRFGRKKALSLSILGMSLPTAMIAILPGYEVLGILSPCLLLFFRLMQGFCTGGEYNGAAIFAIEHLREKTGLVSGLISASCVLGAVCATLCGYIFTQENMPVYAWRIPFLMGAFIGIIGWYIRCHLKETDAFLFSSNKTSLSIRNILKNHKKPFFLAVGIGAYNGVLSYTLFGFLTVYLSRYVGLSFSYSIFYNFYGMLTFMLACPLFGYFCDRFGVLWMMRRTSIFGIIGSLISFFFLRNALSSSSLFLGQIFLGLAVASFVGPSHAFLQNLFPTSIRYTGVAGGFSLGMAVTGSSTAIALSFFIEKTGFLWSPALYIIMMAFLWEMVFRKLFNYGLSEELSLKGQRVF